MKQKILIIDDNPDIRQMINIALSAEYEVLEASNGANALEIFKKDSPLVTLLDITLPDIDGIVVLKSMLNADAKAMVIMLTGNEDIDVARNSIGLGAAEYITKPFDMNYLRTVVKNRVEIRSGERKPDEHRPWKVTE